MSSQLILDLDNTLRTVLQQPTIENLQRCFSLIKQCHFRRMAEEGNAEADDSLYIPTILLLRQFSRFQQPSTFDQLLQEFLQLFPLMPISSKKILDDLLCIISLILTKRIMNSNDEVQQDLFIRVFQQFIRATQTNRKFFYEDFLGNFNQNLPILGHFLSCFLQLYEKFHTLDYRLQIIETITSLFSLDNFENDRYNETIGQIIACFLPGILKTFTQELSSLHHRLIESSLQLLTAILRVTIRQSSRSSYPIQSDLKDLLVERNPPWLAIVDQHLAGILQRLIKDYRSHENIDVRRALGNFCLAILCYSSQWLPISSNLALKAIFVLISSKDQFPILNILLRKVFKCNPGDQPPDSLPDPSSLLPLEKEILHSTNLLLSDQLLVRCQTDLFQLFDQQSAIFKDRQWRLQLFLGYYTFIHQHVDFLFHLETFTEKFFRFVCNSIDLQIIYRDNLNLLNQTSLPEILEIEQYDSIYKHLKSDVHEEIEGIFRVFLPLNSDFLDYVLEQLDRKQINCEINQKIFYLLAVLLGETTEENLEEYQRILSLLDQLISEEKTNRGRRKRKKEEPISVRNLTIYYLLHCLRRFAPPDQIEYHIDYVPLLLLCHSSIYTIIHQTSFLCLTSFTSNLPSYLASQAEYIVDTSLRKIQTSTFDGYLILIEFLRLGGSQVVNLPLMTHVIEQVLLELASLPSVESIQLIFEFLNLFCQQVTDISKKATRQKKPLDRSPAQSLIEFTLALQKQQHPPNEENETSEEKSEEKHPWHTMLVSIVDVFQHFISHADAQIRSYVLDAFPSLARLLSTIDENLFLPLVHKVWPGLVHRLYDKDVNIRIRCLKTVQCLCELCSDFVDRRIRQDIFPVLFQQLESNRQLSATNVLEFRYMKYLLTNIGSILNCLTLQFDEIEKLILILFQYLQMESLASIAHEQLIVLKSKYADHIWLRFSLHDENEYRKGFFPAMKVYKPEPMLRIDSKWKRKLLDC